MRAIAFALSGEYALFKRPYSPASPMTYPLPPPPTVLGILGAILGLDKGEYLRRLGGEQVRVAVALAAPVRTFRAALNLLQTKDGTDRYFRPRAGKNTHTQVPCTFLRDPRFRIWVTGMADDLADALAERLRTRRFHYSIALGWANCLADAHWLGEGGAEPLPAGEYQVATAVPLGEGVRVHYENGRHYHRLRIPAAMDDRRIVQRYQEIVLAEDARPLRVAVPEGVLYRVGDEPLAFI